MLKRFWRKAKALGKRRKLCSTCKDPHEKEGYAHIYAMGKRWMQIIAVKRDVLDWDITLPVNGFKVTPVPKIVDNNWIVDLRKKDEQ